MNHSCPFFSFFFCNFDWIFVISFTISTTYGAIPVVLLSIHSLIINQMNALVTKKLESSHQGNTMVENSLLWAPC